MASVFETTKLAITSTKRSHLYDFLGLYIKIVLSPCENTSRFFTVWHSVHMLKNLSIASIPLGLIVIDFITPLEVFPRIDVPFVFTMLLFMWIPLCLLLRRYHMSSFYFQDALLCQASPQYLKVPIYMHCLACTELGSLDMFKLLNG